MLYEFTLEEKEIIDNFTKIDDTEGIVLNGFILGSEKNKLFDVIEDLEIKKINKLKNEREILEDAKKVINEAILFECAHLQIGEDNAKEYSLTRKYVKTYKLQTVIFWRWKQLWFEAFKENKNEPQTKVFKSGMRYYLEQIAIPKHIAALKGTTLENELNNIINSCLDNSQYIIDDQKDISNSLQLEAYEPTIIKHLKREMVLDNNYDVAMSNRLIESGVNRLNSTELKLLRLAISQSKMNDKDLYVYEISAKEFADFFNLDIKNIYVHIRKMVKRISAETVNIINNDLEYIKTIPWVRQCVYSNGIITIELNDLLKPYILELKDCFSKIKIEEYKHYKSNYSIILRELLQSRMNHEKVYADKSTKIKISVEDLKRVTNSQNYTNISDFRKRVLNVAINEINANNFKYHITVTPNKTGRTIDSFDFIIESKTGHNQKISNKNK